MLLNREKILVWASEFVDKAEALNYLKKAKILNRVWFAKLKKKLDSI